MHDEPTSPSLLRSMTITDHTHPSAHLPHDLDSSPSSPSSGTPTFYDARRRSKHHRSDGSSSSHLLARLVSREEEVRELNAALLVTSERLETESSRANAAERRALDYFHRLRIATENRERAEQDSARLREELKLYKLQLENAQKEIFRAQDIIDQVAAQRNEAEADAARARTKARKLQEERLVMVAREEGRRVGYKEGLSVGRRIGYDQGRPRWPSHRHPHHTLSLEHDDADENARELVEDITDDERNDPRSHHHASIRHHPYVNDCAAPASLPTLITEYAPIPPPLYVRLNPPRHFLSHRVSVLSPLLASILHLVNPTNPKRSIRYRYRSALAPTHPPTTSPTIGSQEPILAHPTSHPRANLFPPPPAPSRPISRVVGTPLNQSQPESHHPSGPATMLIRRPFPHPLSVPARPRSHHVPRPISPNTIW